MNNDRKNKPILFGVLTSVLISSATWAFSSENHFKKASKTHFRDATDQEYRPGQLSHSRKQNLSEPSRERHWGTNEKVPSVQDTNASVPAHRPSHKSFSKKTELRPGKTKDKLRPPKAKVDAAKKKKRSLRR